MVSSRLGEERMMSTAQQPVEQVAAEPDPSWRGLYRAGGVSAFLYIFFALVFPTILFLSWDYDTSMNGAAHLEYIAANRLWWYVLQTSLLGSSVIAIVFFAAIYAALKHINKSYAAIGVMLAITAQILFVAYYPVLLGTIYLSNQYVAASEAQQAVYAAASEALLAMVNAFNPFYESFFAISILIISLVMLKGVFHKSVAYLGILSCVAAFVGLSLWPIIGIAYFWWWAILVIWMIAVGWKLYQLGGVSQ